MLVRKPSKNLLALVEKAYDVFARPTPQSLCVCMCNVCMNESTEVQLRTTPLRKISRELLAEYTNSAHGAGDAHELQYFLPRYFDLLAHGELPSHLCIEVCLERLGDHPWQKWPQSTLVEEVLKTMFDDALNHSTPLGYEEFEDVLIMLSHAGAKSDELLNHEIRAAMEQQGKRLLQIARRLGEIWSTMQGHKLANSFWRQKPKAAIEKVLFSDTTLQCMLWVSENTQDSNLKALLDRAFERM